MFQSLLRKIDLKNKKTISIFGGVFSTFFIFLIIYIIILPSGVGFNSVKDSSVVDFVRLRKNDFLNERQRALPDKPPPPKKPSMCAVKAKHHLIPRATLDIFLHG